MYRGPKVRYGLGRGIANTQDEWESCGGGSSYYNRVSRRAMGRDCARLGMNRRYCFWWWNGLIGR